MVEFQDSPDETIEHDEKKELCSFRTFHLFVAKSAHDFVRVILPVKKRF